MIWLHCNKISTQNLNNNSILSPSPPTTNLPMIQSLQSHFVSSKVSSSYYFTTTSAHEMMKHLIYIQDPNCLVWYGLWKFTQSLNNIPINCRLFSITFFMSISRSHGKIFNQLTVTKLALRPCLAPLKTHTQI